MPKYENKTEASREKRSKHYKDGDVLNALQSHPLWAVTFAIWKSLGIKRAFPLVSIPTAPFCTDFRCNLAYCLPHNVGRLDFFR